MSGLLRASDPVLLRAAALYLPIAGAVLAGLTHGRRPRRFAACLLGMLWTTPSLLLLQIANRHAGWWSFASDGPTLRGMPLELYLGWIVLWGLCPQLALPSLPLPACLTLMTAVDLVAMPLCAPVVRLGPHWLTGEAVAVLLVLAPGLALARWTADNRHLGRRAALQIVTAAQLFLFFLPETIFALRPGPGWAPLLALHGWRAQLAVGSALLLALPGVSAVFEFAERGGGTPIPYDPPTRLVVSGLYRYVANPMQLSCAATMLLWAGLLRSGWMLLATLLTLVYSAGLAEWDEREDLDRRFGAVWRKYRAHVPSWRPRLLPYRPAPQPAATLYVAATCGPCSELRRWIEAREPRGLQIVDAESLPQGSIRRIRYVAESEAVEGVRALARALEHLHLGWALAGAALRLPVVWRAIQLVMDVSGFGPRTLPNRSAGIAAAVLTPRRPGSSSAP